MREVSTLYQDGEGRNYCADCGSHYVVSPQEAEAYTALYEALKALVDHFRCNDENYYKSDLCTDALSALAKAEGK